MTLLPADTGLHLGFTGTCSIDRKCRESIEHLHRLLITYRDQGYETLHHGDAVGADHLAHEMASELGYDVIVHPPRYHSMRAFCESGNIVMTMPEKPYLARNRDIVDAVSLLVAMPVDPDREERRSGTWMTVRYARKTGIPVVMVRP